MVKLTNARLICGHVLDALKRLPDNSVHCIVTSPPYWGIRAYNTGKWTGGDPSCDHVKGELRTGLGLASSVHNTRGGAKKCASVPSIQYAKLCEKCGATKEDRQLGQEDTIEEYTQNLVDVLHESRRVLHPSGVLVVNLGDVYAGSGKGPSNSIQQGNLHSHEAVETKRGMNNLQDTPTKWLPVPDGCKPKDLVGAPWLLAFALRKDGWWLRSHIPWLKKRAMPSSVTDRPGSSVEDLFLLAKKGIYFWDAEAIKMPLAESSIGRLAQDVENQAGTDRANGGAKTNGPLRAVGTPTGRNRRNSDWFFETWQGLALDEDGDPLALVVNPGSYRDAHFATFSTKLVEPFVKAGSCERGVCPKCAEPFRRVLRSSFIPQEDVRDPEKPYKASRKGMDPLNGWGDTPRGTMSTATLGWRPNCECAGVEIIDDPPTPPIRKRTETDADFEERRRVYDIALVGWQDWWSKLHPVYDALPSAPSTVMDIFNGSGTSGVVALQLGRNYIGIDLSEPYIEMARKRIEQETDPLFSKITVEKI